MVAPGRQVANPKAVLGVAMPCLSCEHRNRAGLDRDLAGGVSNREVGRRYGIGEKAIARHRRNHVSPALVPLAQAEQVAGVRDAQRTALDRVTTLAEKVEAVLIKAEVAGQTHAFLSAARELRGGIELLAKLSGELKPDGVQVQVLNLQTSPEWIELRSAVMHALAPFPEARAAVAAAITSAPQAPQIPAVVQITAYRPDAPVGASVGALEDPDGIA